MPLQMAPSGKLADIITRPKCKSGQVRKIKDFYGCSRFREGCNFVINEKSPGNGSLKIR